MNAEHAGREIIIMSLSCEFSSYSHLIRAPFIALIPTSNDFYKIADSFINTLLELGCVEFCILGPEAEKLHDFIDEIIEKKEAFAVATTWDEDVKDGCDYFLNAAGGGVGQLLAFTAEHPRIHSILASQLQF